MKIPTTIPVILELDVAALTDAYVEEGQSVWDEEPPRLSDHITNAVADKIAKTIEADIRAAVQQRVEAEVASQVEKILAGPIVRTNSYGEPISGPAKSLREMVTEEATKELTKSRGSGYDRNPSVLDRVIKGQVEQVLAKELNDEIARAKAEVKGAVHGKVSDVITDAIERVRLGRL